MEKTMKMKLKKLQQCISMILLLALAFSPVQALEEVEVEVVRELSTGINSTWLTKDQEGRQWFVKLDGGCKDRNGDLWINYGNFEAEIIASKIFRDFGLLCPRVEPVNIKGRGGLYLRAEWVDESFTGGARPKQIKEVVRGDSIDVNQVRLLQVLDVLLGNGDRHEENLLFAPGKEGMLIPIPIDNNLALSDRSVVAYGDWQFNFRTELTNVDHLMQRNSIYQRYATRPGAAEDYIRIVRLVREKLTDDYLQELIANVDPDVITFGNPMKRKRDILKTLQSRRDRLVRFFDKKYFEDKGATQRILMDHMHEMIPDHVFKGLQLGSFETTYLAISLDRGIEFDGAELYFRLRAVTGDTLVAREILGYVCEFRGEPFPLKHVLTVETGFEMMSHGRAIRQYLEAPLAGMKPLD